jgi:hypothetical protein
MKKATSIVIEKFPSLKKHIEAEKNMLVRQHSLDELESEVEKVFLQLVWFFEEPEINDFDLKNLYLQLENEWLVFALDVINYYFKKDTYLIQENIDSVLVSDDYLDQSGASRYLEEIGLKNFSQSKIATYIYRGTFPKEDLLISGKKFWRTNTLDKYALSFKEGL